MWVISINAYSTLPDRIPVHFNWDGTPDRWGNKSILNFFMLPGLSTIISLFMLIISRYPQVYNFPQKEEVKLWPPEYRKLVYAILNRMMYLIGLAISILFLFIQFQIIQGAKSRNFSPSDIWPVWILVAGIVLMPIYYLVHVSRRVKEIKELLAQKR